MDSKYLPGWLVVSLPDQPSVSEPAGAHGGSASVGAHGERAGAGASAGAHGGRAILGLLLAPSGPDVRTGNCDWQNFFVWMKTEAK